MGKTTELLTLLKTGNSDAARKLIAKLKKSGKKKAQAKELNTPDDNGQTVIHYCAANNFIEFIQDLIELGAAIDIADDKGYTPLHVASGAGRTSAVTALLSRGADPNIVSRGGDTPLHLACQNGHAPAVEALVSEGANCTMLNVSGHTPLDLACQNGHAQVVGLLLRSGQFSQAYLQRSDMPHTALLLAAKQGNNEVIGLLVKHGFDVNRRLPGSQGTCLHEAALYGKVDTVRYLLQCGADVAAVNAQGLTALDIVNMYTDPRSAGMMKQVLQDALAQQARVRIAQQHQQHQPQHQPKAQPQHQPQHQPKAQPQAQHQPKAQHQHQPQLQHQHQPQQQQQAYHTPPASSRAHQPVGFNYLQMGSQQAHPTRQGSLSEHQRQVHHTPPTPKQQQPAAFNYLQLGAQQLHPQRQGSAGEGGHMEQRAHTYTGGQHHQPTRHGYQHQQSHPQSQIGEYHQQQSYEAAATTSPGVALGGTPDLAAMIAAKAASRKPMLGSPTKKDFPAGDERFTRSATMTYGDGMTDVRQAALHRRGSYSDRSSTSPEQDHYDRSNPPTLPRRTHMGPPQFKPVPPPVEGDLRLTARPERRLSGRSSHSDRSPSPESTGGSHSLQQRSIQSEQRPRLRKIQPKALPPSGGSSVDDELLKKLLHRQNRMQQAEQSPESVEGVSEQPAEETSQPEQQAVEEPATAQPKTSKPPPIPERKTASLSTQASLPAEGEKPPHPEKLLRVEKTVEAPAPQPKPKPKPPPPKPKEPSSSLSPWQEELLKRKQRMAQYETEAQAESQEAEKQEHPQNPPAQAVEQEHPPEPAREPPRDPVREPPPEPAREPPRDPVREPPRDPVREPPPEPAREPPRDPVREPPRDPVREPPPEPVREPPPEPAREPPREPAREPQRAPPPERLREPPPEHLPEPVREPVRPPVAEPPPPREAPPEPTIEPPESIRETPQELPQEPTREPPQEPPRRPLREPVRVPQPELPAAPLKSAEEPLSSKKPPDELRIKPSDSLIGAPSTPTSDQLSRSTSLSSLATTTGTASPTQGSLEPLPIVEWLTAYKLQEYVPLFEAQGYDNTEFLAGITQEELSELGVQKIGHRKKVLTALSALPSREHFLGGTKPSSVPLLLQMLSLSQYEAVLLEAGYDDIDFVTDITPEELVDVGISKKAHLKRLMKGIAELGEVMKNVIPAFSPIPPPPSFNGSSVSEHPPPEVPFSEQPTAVVPVKTSLGWPEKPPLEEPTSVQLPEPPLELYHGEAESRPLQDSIGPYAANSGLKSEQSLPNGDESGSSEAALSKFDSRSPSASPQVQRKAGNRPGAPPPPKRSTSTALSSVDSLGLSRQSLSDSSTSLSSAERMGLEITPPTGAQQVEVQQSPPKIPPKLSRKPPRAPRAMQPEMTDCGSGGEGERRYLASDIHSVLQNEEVRLERARGEGEPSGDALDELSRALEGFEPETGQTNEGSQPEPEEEADQLLADIDDMLADLNTHLDFMIPGSS